MEAAQASGAVAEPEPETWVPGQTGTARVEASGNGGEEQTSPDIGLGDPNEQPAPPADAAQRTRRYVVLEEVDLGEHVLGVLSANGIDFGDLTEQNVREALAGHEAYLVAGEVDSRNTEHALRTAAKARYGDRGGQPVMNAIPGRNWKPTLVTVRTDTHVSLG